MSHTVTAKVSFAFPKSPESPLGKAIVKMGGKVLGNGTHRLYQGSEQGFGFTLPNWKYPLVLKENGEMKFDDYHGSWGNPKDLESMKGHYAIEAARAKADELGWLAQDCPEGLQIYHPSGGMLTVTPAGIIDANGFVGGACAAASHDIVAAMGGAAAEVRKPEFEQESANVRNQEG